MKPILSKIKNIDWLAYFLVVFFVIVFIWLSFIRHDSLKSYLNDIGTYDQAIWNTLHGRFMQITTSMYDENNFLAGHFSPILLFFVPFYAIWASPKWLLIFQALAVGAGAIPIYLLAKEKLKNYWVALVFLLSFLLNFFLHNALLYDFHEVVLAVAFSAWAFYFLEKRNNKFFYISSIFLAICQEHLALLVFMMGLYAFFVQKRRRFGLAVSAISLAYFFLIIGFVMPHLSHTGRPALLENNAQYENRYAWLGTSMPEIIKNIISHPLTILFFILSGEKLKYLFVLGLPVFSLCFYSWPIVIIFPILLINLLSLNSMTYNVFFYHSVVAIPFIYFSAIFTFKRWFLKELFLRRIFLFFILASSVGSMFLYSLAPIFSKQAIESHQPAMHAKKIAEVKKIIPKEASLSVQHNLGPHFAEREKIYRFPLKKDEAEYILLDKTNPYAEDKNYFSQFGYALQMDFSDWQKKIEELMNSSNYELLYAEDGYLIFRKKK